MNTHAPMPHTLPNPQSQSLSYSISHNSPRQCTIKEHPPQPLPLISTLSPTFSPLLLSTCYPPLCLSHSASVLLILSEKKRQSRKSPLHLCHTLPCSLLSLAPVSRCPPSCTTIRRCLSPSTFLFCSSRFILHLSCLTVSLCPLGTLYVSSPSYILPPLFPFSWDVIC